VEGGVTASRGLMAVLTINAAMILLIGVFAQFFITWVNSSVAMLVANGF
jgi:hypothetical protein